MTRQGIIHHGPVTADQLPGRPVVSQQAGNIGVGLFAHRVLEIPAKPVARLAPSVIHQGNRLLHLEPLGDEGANKRAVAALVSQEPVRLGFQDFRVSQLTRGRQLTQLGIRRCAKQHEAQS